MRSRSRFAVSALAAAGLGIASCKGTPTNSNNCGSGTPPSLAGSYALSDYTFGSSVYSVPPASGVLTLTASTYAQSLTLPVAKGDTTIADNGTYLIVGSECLYETSQAGMRPFSGSFKLTSSPTDTTLRLSGNDSVHIIISVWKKSP